MAKELPYFKFEPNEWENGNIQIFDRETKGLFIDLCSMYWSRVGDLPLKLAIQKLCGGNASALNSLCDEKIIEVIDGFVFIKFLSIQLNEFGDLSKQNSENAKIGWEKRRNKALNDNKKPNKSERNATALNSLCENDAIREDKIKEDEIILLEKETKSILKEKIEFDFSKSSEAFKEYFLNEFIKAPKQKKKTKELQNKILIDLQNYDEPFAIELMKKSVLNNWQGYKFETTDEHYSDYLRKKENGNNAQWKNGSVDGIPRAIGKQSHVFTGAEFSSEMQERIKNQGIFD